VCLLPNGENALVSYAGAPDGRPWVLELEAGAAVPPNLEDCHFRLMVRGNHNEQKELLRLQHGGLWDQGRNLHLPDHQRSGVDLSDLAEEFALYPPFPSHRPNRELSASSFSIFPWNDGKFYWERHRGTPPALPALC
ncbi:hypothetical protein T484DRAFT_1753254, partial [Baffinella frigidus]